jgi:hypothetical protein
VLGIVFDETPPRRVVELTERRYARPTVSRTFEGRDRFAPAAAWLAKGAELSAFGRPAGQVHRIELAQPSIGPDGIAGEVCRVDRFGNLITNIDRKTFEKLGASSIGLRSDPVRQATRCRRSSPPRRRGGREVCAVWQHRSPRDCGQWRERRQPARSRRGASCTSSGVAEA